SRRRRCSPISSDSPGSWASGPPAERRRPRHPVSPVRSGHGCQVRRTRCRRTGGGRPVSNVELDPREIECESGGAPNGPEPGGAAVEIITSRDVPLGGPRAMTVKRTLPQRKRSLIGAWCFVDHFGPDDVSATGGMDVPSHPHTGLQTVSWLFAGNITHHDSGDHHAVVRPGEVNLMTSGGGICHTEVSTQ